MPDDLDVSEFLTSAEELEDDLLADEVFEMESADLGNMGELNFNVQPSAPHPESQFTVPPGVSQPTTMQSTSISPVPTVEGTEGTPIAPMTDQHALETANDDEMSKLFKDLDFEYNEANQQSLAQPMNPATTTPPPGVTNMTGGSSGSTGSTPGVSSPAATKPSPAPAGQTMTPGGSTGTTPSSAPMSQGYGQPKVMQTDSIDNPLEEAGNDLSSGDEKLINEFDSLA